MNIEDIKVGCVYEFTKHQASMHGDTHLTVSQSSKRSGKRGHPSHVTGFLTHFHEGHWSQTEKKVTCTVKALVAEADLDVLIYKWQSQVASEEPTNGGGDIENVLSGVRAALTLAQEEVQKLHHLVANSLAESNKARAILKAVREIDE